MGDYSLMELTWFWNSVENGKLIFLILTLIIGTAIFLAFIYLSYDSDKHDESLIFIIGSGIFILPVSFVLSALFIMTPLLFILAISVVALICLAAIKIIKFKAESEHE